MHKHYIEEKPNVLSAINIVPLIGVLAALLVVIMAGLPSLTQQHVVEEYGWSCVLWSDHTHRLNIRINSDGTTNLDGKPLSQKQVMDFIKTELLKTNHQISAELDVDTNAAYQDVMTIISNLRSAGLDPHRILILDNHE